MFWPRFLSICVIIVIYYTWIRIVMLGHKSGTPISPLKRFLCWRPAAPGARLLLFFLGITWLKLEKPDVDFKKYLGPDWEKTYDGASTIVWNHGSWIDILVGMWWDLPSYVSKMSVRSYPFVGIIAECMQCLFLERTGTREEKEKAIKDIILRQQLS